MEHDTVFFFSVEDRAFETDGKYGLSPFSGERPHATTSGIGEE